METRDGNELRQHPGASRPLSSIPARDTRQRRVAVPALQEPHGEGGGRGHDDGVREPGFYGVPHPLADVC